MGGKKSECKLSFIIFLFILLLIPLASAVSFANLFSDLGNLITGMASSGTFSANITVTNTAPIVQTITIEPSTAYTDTLMHCNITVYDAEGQTLTVYMNWTNGTEHYAGYSKTSVSSGNSLNFTLTPGIQYKLETWNCSARVYDATDLGPVNSTTRTITNTASVVGATSIIGAQSVTEDGTTLVNFTFLASDTDGRSDLDDTTAKANFSLQGAAESRSDALCIAQADVGSSANYSCEIKFWFWDSTGQWNASTYVADLSSAASQNTTLNFSVGESTCIKISPGALTWPSVNLGSTNTLSTAFIRINNTCNDEIASGNVRVDGVNLRGETTTTEYLNVGNFSSNINLACEGTQLVNNTATGITSSVLAAGNHSIGLTDNSTGTECLHFCAETIPLTGISTQAYSTNGIESWTVDVI